MKRLVLCLVLSLITADLVPAPTATSRHAWMVRKLGGKMHVKTMIA